MHKRASKWISLAALALLSQAVTGYSASPVDPATARAIQATSTLNQINAPISPSGCGQSAPCNEPFAPVTADDSPNKAYFENLLKRGKDAPIEDFLKLWYPQRNKADPETYLFGCEIALWRPLRTENTLIPKQCTPDVLYSWGPPEKLAAIENNLPNGKAWKGPVNDPNHSNGQVWATISPASTYSYGLVPIRFKFKPGTRFIDAFDFSGDQVIAYTSLQEDFVITNSKSVESWSFGTPELYDEIVKDILRIASGKQAMTYENREPRGTGLERVYDAGVPERRPQNEATLKENLLGLIQMILNGEGRIYYAQGACQNRAKAYSTTRPTYFNQ